MSIKKSIDKIIQIYLYLENLLEEVCELKSMSIINVNKRIDR